MNHPAPDSPTESLPLTNAFSVRTTEQRLEALCQLVDEDLRGVSIDDLALTEYSRRLTGEIDQAMAEETSWFDSIDFN